ncbi:unnamed protein product, partial [Effrenium voratum]
AWLLAKLRLRDPFLWHEVRLRARSCARQLTLHQLTAILASSVRAGLLDQAFLSAMAFRLDTLLCWGPRATSRSTTDLILCCNALLRAGLDVKSPLYQESCYAGLREALQSRMLSRPRCWHHVSLG